MKKLRINGRRGAFQLIYGILYGGLAANSFEASVFLPTVTWVGEYLHSPAFLGIPWAIATVFAIVGAFLPRPADRYSFAALAVAATMWAGLYIVGAILTPQTGSISGTVLYLALAGSVLVCSGMNGDCDRDDRPVIK